MKKFNPKVLPYLAAVVQTAQFSLAGSILIGPKGWFFVGLLGAIASFALAYASSQYADIAQRRKGWSLGALILLGIFSPVVVGTATWLDMTIIQNTYWRGVVAFAWGTLPDLSVILSGFIAGKSLVSLSETKPSNNNRSANTNGRSAKKSKAQATVPCLHAGAGCERKFGSQNAANAHAKSCGFKPTVVDQSLLISKVEKK